MKDTKISVVGRSKMRICASEEKAASRKAALNDAVLKSTDGHRGEAVLSSMPSIYKVVPN